ncbi:MAG: hypothetical protein KGL95_15445, partial [Patescibacteria group bacterium]|nr:hypothetical protein [Patescibacteria group bacterium]
MDEIAEKIISEDIKIIVDDIRNFSNILEGKRLLIIGGKGFLGTYFLKTAITLNKTLQKPMKITVLDNLITAKEMKG